MSVNLSEAIKSGRRFKPVSCNENIFMYYDDFVFRLSNTKLNELTMILKDEYEIEPEKKEFVVWWNRKGYTTYPACDDYSFVGFLESLIGKKTKITVEILE